jgi:hypothetical protein
VPDKFVPKVGLKFDALEDAYEYYCDYAKLAGFDVRKGRKNSEVQWFFCNKEGVTPPVSKPHDYVNHMFMRP